MVYNFEKLIIWQLIDSIFSPKQSFYISFVLNSLVVFYLRFSVSYSVLAQRLSL